MHLGSGSFLPDPEVSFFFIESGLGLFLHKSIVRFFFNVPHNNEFLGPAKFLKRRILLTNHCVMKVMAYALISLSKILEILLCSFKS